MRLLGFIFLLVAAGMVYIRLAPINPAAFSLGDSPKDVGDFDNVGGFTAVRQVEAEDVLAKVTAAMLALPRTVLVQENPMAFVTRSRVFGFPDVTVVSVQNGHLIVRGHLVYGKSDLGVNKARILRILGAL